MKTQHLCFRYLSNMDLSKKFCFHQTSLLYIFYQKIILCIDLLSICIVYYTILDIEVP